jgi:uncharacterized protein YecE (DUF72 family)
MTPAFARFLAERGLAMVVVDRVGQPELFPLWDALVQEQATPDFVIVRWIGDDKNGPKGDAEITTPRDEELERWAERLAGWYGSGLDIYGYMHNPYEGHSPASLRRLQQRLAPHAPLPAWPPPSLSKDATEQMSLF